MTAHAPRSTQTTYSNSAHPGERFDSSRPVAYQVIDGKRCPVAATYTVTGKTVGFRLGQYDRRHPLIIDPVLSYFSYLGGTGNDYIGNSFPEGEGLPRLYRRK